MVLYFQIFKSSNFQIKLKHVENIKHDHTQKIRLLFSRRIRAACGNMVELAAQGSELAG
jgi:hypothetical protein